MNSFDCSKAGESAREQHGTKLGSGTKCGVNRPLPVTNGRLVERRVLKPSHGQLPLKGVLGGGRDCITVQNESRLI